MFNRKICQDFLKLAQITYGGEFYLKLKNYEQKSLNIEKTVFNRVPDRLLSQNGNNDFYSYKNEESGFVANLFENIKKKFLVIAYRGTERFGLGENVSDLIALMKDVATDTNLLTGNLDLQFTDAWKFYKTVKSQYPKKKIIIVGQSLGGALAQLVAAKEYTVNRIKVETYSYNAPGCKHLLDIFDCNTNFKYSFITNYSVMNDWCGMFGEHIGKRFLLPPIEMKDVDPNSQIDVINNILLTTHEGIFDYNSKMGKIIKKPKDFNQTEGLSLWYFDKKNPIQNFRTLSEFFGANSLKLNLLQNDFMEETFQNAKKILEEKTQDILQSSNIGLALKNMTDSISQTQTIQKEKFLETFNKNMITQAVKHLDAVFSELDQDSYERAKSIVKREIKNSSAYFKK